MINSVIYIVLLGGFLMTACANPAQRTEQPRDADALLWERSRQCADQAERIGTRKQREGAVDNRFPKVTSWENHYNRKDQRCYVELSFFNPEAGAENRTFLPLLHKEMYDAFENLQIAIHTDQPGLDEGGTIVYCRIADPLNARSTSPVACAAVRTFRLERLTQ